MITNAAALAKILESQTGRAMNESAVSVISLCILGSGRTQWVSMGSFNKGVLTQEGGLRGKVFHRKTPFIG